MKLKANKFYIVEFLTNGNPIDGPSFEKDVVCYIGELGGRHLFDSMSTVRVLGPNDRITNGPADEPIGAFRISYKEEA